jgi:MFS family permease
MFSGWGNGFNTATTPLWVSELTPARSRGRHVAIEGNLIALGIVIAYYFNIGLSYTTGPVQWRTPIAAQGIIILAQIGWVYLLPESPRWLTKRASQSATLAMDIFFIEHTDRLREQIRDTVRRSMSSPRCAEKNSTIAIPPSLNRRRTLTRP